MPSSVYLTLRSEKTVKQKRPDQKRAEKFAELLVSQLQTVKFC